MTQRTAQKIFVNRINSLLALGFFIDEKGNLEHIQTHSLRIVM